MAENRELDYDAAELKPGIKDDSMTAAVRSRIIHYLLLTSLCAVLTLPGLDRMSLWDMDEGLNAEAAREMYESCDWIVPKFNYQLRDAKPALLYWLQCFAYRLFGVNEFSARLPSALMMTLAVVLLYELGRQMRSPAFGLLAGVILATNTLVCLIGHFANPDATLLACTCGTFLAFWLGYAPKTIGGPTRSAWPIPFGIACGIAVLAKGPVGIVLPAGAVGLTLLWQRDLKQLLRWRVLHGMLAFVLVAAPWYVAVSLQTRGAFAKGFFLNNNIGRYLSPMEEHNGSVFYHALVAFPAFAPWSFLMPAALVVGLRRVRGNANDPVTLARRLAFCWFGVFLGFYSFAATKLPNYALAMYPAMALIAAMLLDDWRIGAVSLPRWYRTAAGALAIIAGVAFLCCFLILSGWVTSRSIPQPPLRGLESWGWIGMIPLAGGIVLAWAWWTDRRRSCIVALAATSAVMLAVVSAGVMPEMNVNKATKHLAADAGTLDRGRDIRLASFDLAHPSLVFYCQREVVPLTGEDRVLEFLESPFPAFVFMPDSVWQRLQASPNLTEAKLLARHWDMYRREHVVVVANGIDDQTAFAVTLSR